MKVLISGSSGMIGSALARRLKEAGHEPVALVRSRNAKGSVAPEQILWNPATGAIDLAALEGFDAIVNLGGVSIGQKRWSTKEKARIWDSRVNPTDLLVAHLSSVVARPHVFVSASGVGYYGDSGSKPVDEKSPRGEGFLAALTESWEDAAMGAEKLGIRTVCLRSGIVFSLSGGALAKQVILFRLGMGGRMGSGEQFVSWISLHDEVEAIIHTIKNTTLSGPVNLTSPNPVTNAVFTKSFGRALHRPTWVPAWAWMLKAGFGGQLTEEMLLASQRVLPAKLLKSGFKFRDSEIDDALARVIIDDNTRREQALQQRRFDSRKGRKEKNAAVRYSRTKNEDKS